MRGDVKGENDAFIGMPMLSRHPQRGELPDFTPQ
jgi:hypothetical protein